MTETTTTASRLPLTVSSQRCATMSTISPDTDPHRPRSEHLRFARCLQVPATVSKQRSNFSLRVLRVQYQGVTCAVSNGSASSAPRLSGSREDSSNGGVSAAWRCSSAWRNVVDLLPCGKKLMLVDKMNIDSCTAVRQYDSRRRKKAGQTTTTLHSLLHYFASHPSIHSSIRPSVANYLRASVDNRGVF